jgi:hypothetical protein
LNALEAVHLEPGVPLWAWDEGRWLATEAIEVKMGSRFAVAVRVQFESGASLAVPAANLKRREPSFYGIDKPLESPLHRRSVSSFNRVGNRGRQGPSKNP